MRGYRRNRGWLAWHVGVLGRVKELPALSDLMGTTPEARVAQTADQQLSILRQWKAALGKSG